MTLESLIDNTTTESDEALGTLDDLVAETTGNADEQKPPVEGEDPKPADAKPPVEAKTPVDEPPADSSIPTDLTDAPETEEEEYNIDTDEGVSDELRADLKKQPQKTQDAFASMRIKIRELEKSTQNAENAGLTDEEKTALINENKQLQEQIEKADFVKSPRFQREYINPANIVQKELVAAGKDYGIEEADMVKAFSMGRAARAEFLAEKISNQSGLAEILPMYTQYGSLLERAKTAVADFNNGARASIAVERENKAQALAANIDAARTKLFSEGYTLLRESKQNPEWLPSLQKEAALIVAGEVDPAAAAEAAMRSVVSKHQIASLSSRLTASQKEIADLRTKLGKYVKLSPSNTGDRSTPTPTAIDPNKATIEDLVKA